MSKFALTFSNKGSIIPPAADLVSLGILPKQISEYTDEDIGSTILIPYTDESGKIPLVNVQGTDWCQYNGSIDFEVIGVNHHKDINDESKPTITLMTRRIIRRAPFDAREPNNPDSSRASYGNNRWSVSNIRQWLNSEGAANEWFTPQHEYDAAPDKNGFGYKYGEYIDEIEAAAYADDPGFLAGFSSDIKQHLATVRNKTCFWDYDKDVFSPPYTEETEDKVFLHSLAEEGYLAEPFIQEGRFIFGIHTLKELYSFTSDGFMKERGFYWLRTPYPSPAYCMLINDEGVRR